MNPFIRFVMKPDGRAWMDMPLPPGMTLPILMHAVRTDGFVVHEQFFIPYDQIKYAALYTGMSQPNGGLKVVPFTPPNGDKPAP